MAKDNVVELYETAGNKYTLKEELKGHDKTVTSVDVAPKSGQIVTCSQGMGGREQVTTIGGAAAKLRIQ